MKRFVLWVAAGLLVVALTLLFFLPASWLTPVIEQQTAGRISLGDPQGSVWRGSAFIGGAAGGNGPVTPLLPGRFSWTVSPLVLACYTVLGTQETKRTTPPRTQPVHQSCRAVLRFLKCQWA